MNRVELSNVVAQVTGNTKKSVDEIIFTAFDAIKEAVARGEDVTIAKFGVFKQTVRPAGTYRNPKTGETVEKGEIKGAKFKISSSFKNTVKGE